MSFVQLELNSGFEMLVYIVAYNCIAIYIHCTHVGGPKYKYKCLAIDVIPSR